MKLEARHERRLADLYGKLPNGKAKLRIVTPSEAVRPHGKLQGLPKYIEPETGQKMPFLVLEMWCPPEMCGSREAWPYDLLGPYPADCQEDCCNGGFWGLKMPLTVNGEYLPVSETLIDAICKKQFIDVEWSLLTEIERQNHIDESLSRSKQKRDEEAWDEFISERDHYATHKTQEDNADNRVFIGFGKNALPETKGGKMPIGKPKI